MNWFTITIGIIFFAGITIGLYMGAIRMAASLAATILTIILVGTLTPFTSAAISRYTPLDEMIRDEVADTMIKQSSTVIPDEMQGLSDLIEQVGEGANIPRDLQMSFIEAAQLPEVFKTLLAENNNDDAYEKYEAKTFPQYVGNYLAHLSIRILGFLATFLVVGVLVRAIIKGLDLIGRLPVLGLVNHMAGGAIGIGVSLIVVWILFLIITLAYSTEIGKNLYETTQNTAILKQLYEFNPILNMILKMK